MNIVVFSPNLNAKTGSPIRALNIIKGLSSYGANYNIVLVSYGFVEALSSKYSCYSVLDFGGVANAIEQAVKENDADLLLCITHGYANVASRVAEYFKIPFFVDIHGIRALEVLEEHVDIVTKIKRLKECLPWFIGVIKANKVFCANPKLYSWLKFFLQRKVVAVCGIADLSMFKFIQNDHDRVKVLYAGNFNPYQGVDLYLDAIKIIGEDLSYEFYVAANNGVIEEKLGKRILELQNQKNVKLIPPVDYNDYPGLLGKMDVFVVPRRPSMTAYMAFPQKIVEAMSAGKCVIATNLSPHKAILTNPSCGILCKPSSEGIADAIIKTKDKELRRRMGLEARKRALKEFDISVQIRKMINHIELSQL